METKTKHRILGLLVIIGLVIILLPLFQGGKEVPTETAVVKAPPFPDQSVQVEASAVSNQVDSKPPAVSPPVAQPEENIADEQPDDTINVTKISPMSENTAQPADNTADDEIKAQTRPVIPVIAETTPEAEKKLAASVEKVVKDNEDLSHLKNTSWVIQVGSFRNKTNALRMVNQLRAKGFKAFIQKGSTAFGERTRVFIGPETKRENARTLASQLESDLHIHGIVISYKPLTL